MEGLLGFSKDILQSLLQETRSSEDIPRATGVEVTSAAVDKAYNMMGDKDPVVKDLLMYTAQKESKYGNDPNTFRFRKTSGGTVGHGGIFQVTDQAVKNIVNSKSSQVQKKLQSLKKQGVDFKEAVEKGNIRKFLEVPVNSALAARLHYFMNKDPLPERDIESGIGPYYMNVYAPQTKPPTPKRKPRRRM